jgi:cytolysin-activating lysine-acyltransferase
MPPQVDYIFKKRKANRGPARTHPGGKHVKAPEPGACHPRQQVSFNEIVSCFFSSPKYQTVTIGQLGRIILPAINLKQFVVLNVDTAHSTDTAYASWAFLTTKIVRDLLSGRKTIFELSTEDWEAGENPWIIDLIAPPEMYQEVLKTIQHTVFAGRRVFPIHGNPQDHATKAVQKLTPYVTRANGEHVFKIAPYLRPADKDELRFASGRDPIAALSIAYTNANECWTIAVRGKPIAMFGVGHVLDQPAAGRIWLVASEDLKNFQNWFLRESRRWVDHLSQKYVPLFNHVCASNTVAISWLQWLGFTFSTTTRKVGKHDIEFWDFSISPPRTRGNSR